MVDTRDLKSLDLYRLYGFESRFGHWHGLIGSNFLFGTSLAVRTYMSEIINIKNMVCPRCIKVVREILDTLGIRYESVQLGQAVLCDALTDRQREKLHQALLTEGFEILDSKESTEVENIRIAIIEWTRMEGNRPNLSDFLQDRLLKEYSAISKQFSQVKAITIERYALLQRIEYAKELISYGEKTFTEIAWILGFSSPAHFSSQFKKETGMSPGQFRSMHEKQRSFIDRI